MIAQREPTPELGPHAYVEGVRIGRGADGRTYILCSTCGKPANAYRHRGFGAIRRVRPKSSYQRPARLTLVRPEPAARPPRPPRSQTREAWYIKRHPNAGMGRGHGGGGAYDPVDHADREGLPRPTPEPTPPAAPATDPGPPTPDAVTGPHPFIASGDSLTDKRGRHHPQCATCGRIQNAKGRHLAVARPAMAARVGSAVAPIAPAASTTRAARSLPAAEYVALALDIDRLLALSTDAIGWKLRVRLQGVRELLKVPDYPTLVTPGAEPDPEAPPPSLVEARPELRPKVLAPAVEAPLSPGLLRGIQSGRHRDLVRRAHDQGWAVDMTGSGHVALTKGHQRLLVSTTVREGRGRGWANLRAQARRAGIDVGGL